MTKRKKPKLPELPERTTFRAAPFTREGIKIIKKWLKLAEGEKAT